MEKLPVILLAAGVGCFGLAGIVSGVLPIMHLRRIPMKTVEQIVPEASYEWKDLARRYPDQFKKYYGEPNVDSYRKALRLGRDTYIGEACWHCHSQYVRPVSNEDIRFGKVSWAGEYQNEMFLPHLFGTRRVGPDLIREAGRHGNDWHVAHFFDPTQVVPTSVMPRYTWFYDGEQPNDRGLAVIAYVQWLGSWATPEAIARQERERRRRMEKQSDTRITVDGAEVPMDLSADFEAEPATGRRAKILLWVSMIFGIVVAGVAFTYKLAEFIFTLNSNSVQGFADVPVTIYFVVATGWLALLAWSYVTGKFKDIESSKWDMLRQEMEYERRGE